MLRKVRMNFGELRSQLHIRWRRFDASDRCGVHECVRRQCKPAQLLLHNCDRRQWQQSERWIHKLVWNFHCAKLGQIYEDWHTKLENLVNGFKSSTKTKLIN